MSCWTARGSGRCTAVFGGSKRRYRVEASPDAEYVLINGTKMTAASIHQGDEIGVGGCRIFLLRNDEDPDNADAQAQAAVG